MIHIYGRVGENPLEIFSKYSHWKITCSSFISLRNFFPPHLHNLNFPPPLANLKSYTNLPRLRGTHKGTSSHISPGGPGLVGSAPRRGRVSAGRVEGRWARTRQGGLGKGAWEPEAWGVILVVEVLDVRSGNQKNGENGRNEVKRVVVEAD